MGSARRHRVFGAGRRRGGRGAAAVAAVQPRDGRPAARAARVHRPLCRGARCAGLGPSCLPACGLCCGEKGGSNEKKDNEWHCIVETVLFVKLVSICGRGKQKEASKPEMPPSLLFALPLLLALDTLHTPPTLKPSIYPPYTHSKPRFHLAHTSGLAVSCSGLGSHLLTLARRAAPGPASSSSASPAQAPVPDKNPDHVSSGVHARQNLLRGPQLPLPAGPQAGKAAAKCGWGGVAFDIRSGPPSLTNKSSSHHPHKHTLGDARAGTYCGTSPPAG